MNDTFDVLRVKWGHYSELLDTFLYMKITPKLPSIIQQNIRKIGKAGSTRFLSDVFFASGH